MQGWTGRMLLWRGQCSVRVRAGGCSRVREDSSAKMLQRREVSVEQICEVLETLRSIFLSHQTFNTKIAKKRIGCQGQQLYPAPLLNVLPKVVQACPVTGAGLSVFAPSYSTGGKTSMLAIVPLLGGKATGDTQSTV